MIEDLQAIFQRNSSLKNEFNSLKDSYVKTIYKGLLTNRNVSKIHQDLYDETINSKNNDPKAYEIAVKTTSKIKKMLPTREIMLDYAKIHHPKYADKIKTEDDALALLIIASMTRTKLEKNIQKAFNEKRQQIADDGKEKAIEDDIAENRKLGKVFYLCSEHKDCALDHLHLQGRIYIDNNWQNIIEEESLKKEIQSYINQHKTLTLQEVTHRPYWLITRPHCRHYFKSIDAKQVLTKSVKKLIRKYNMKKNIGDREYLQTMDSGVGSMQRKLIGEYRNAQLMLDKYKERLKLHKELNDIRTSPILRDAIVKDKFLINKWKKYMTEIERRGGA